MSISYDAYLDEHIYNVQHGLQWMRDHISEVAEPDIWEKTLENVKVHDQSKYSTEEYDAYDNYFYGNRSYQVVKNFDYAWLSHIHSNKHHWQHWILIEDDRDGNSLGKFLDIPREHLLEMIADWWSFSWKTENLGEIFNWYEDHKDTIIMHPMSKIFVETVLSILKKALIEEELIPDDHESDQHYGTPMDQGDHGRYPWGTEPDVDESHDIVIEHSEDDEDKYGIPELKKYPMPDQKHVLSAIRFFNYVDPKHEEELAEAILDRIKEYGMSFDDFGVGEENRFYKYLPEEVKKKET